jgi:predicted nucleic acid-binding Zn ribbon protein
MRVETENLTCSVCGKKVEIDKKIIYSTYDRGPMALRQYCSIKCREIDERDDR